ncbi:MAG: hypothetical protein ABIJ00_02035 [Candidatus Eisenbacteria bacterium]
MRERDIDLLLLEEFAASADFARWFARLAAELDLSDVPVLSVQRSVTTSIGESDIEVALVRRDGAIHYLLIENKVSSGFQPRQAERYRERGEMYVRHGECSGYTVVLAAPEKYIGGRERIAGFDSAVAYEEIRNWFANCAEMGDRSEIKQRILTSAIEKCRLGCQGEEDRPVTEFWHSYWRLVSKVAPELEMTEPISKPAAAGFIWFTPGVLPSGITVVHKLARGNVDLQFAGKGRSLAQLRTKLERHLEPGMTIERATESGAVRLKVPVLDTTVDFDKQATRAEHGMVAAKRLLSWYMRIGGVL